MDEYMRKLDSLGRIVLPEPLRLGLDMKEGDNIIVSKAGNLIILQKSTSSDTNQY